MNNCVSFFNDAQGLFSQLFAIPIFSIIITFVVTTLVSLFSFHVFIFPSYDYEGIKNFIIKLKCLTEGSDKYYYYLCLMFYCVLTGILATAIASIQFHNNPNLATTVIYGVLGPYALREKLFKSIGVRSETATKQVFDQMNNDRKNEFKNYLVDFYENSKDDET